MPIEPYGHTSDGQEVLRIRLHGQIDVALITYGALITELWAPGEGGTRDGARANVVLGLPDLATYEAHNPSFGVTVGRFANRIAGARFALDGTEYALDANEGPNTLHGGKRGFGKRVWTLVDATETTATLRYVAADGEGGFPGRVDTTVRFTVDGATLAIDYEARTDRPTVVNLTNHSYFNLAGEGSGSALGHVLQLAASTILELDAASLPTGRRLDVAATPFDFRTPQPLGARIRDAHPQILHGLGYDCCYVLDAPPTPGAVRQVAQLHDPASARCLTVRTDQPALQLYTANKLTGALAGPGGRTYRAGDGVCLETQHFPDSPNHPGFPTTTLRPGEVFHSRTEFAFSVAPPLGAPAALG